MAKTTSEIVKTNGQKMQRWEPFERFNEEMSRLWNMPYWPFPRFFGRMMRPLAETGMGWSPSVDVYEKGDKLFVKAELPGVKKEDVSVMLDEGDLVISGERKAEHEVREQDYYRLERSFGSFYRRIPVSLDIQPDQIEANFKDGILEVVLPKPAEQPTKAKKIAVK